jgi:hypothetical protein
MKQFILIINGPMVGGKTSALEIIMSQYKKVFRLSPNKIKFLISDYTPERDRTLVHECTMLIADKMLESGMSLVVEGGSVMQGKLNDNLTKLAEKYGIAVTIVNIEAPLPKLLARFNERVMNAPMKGSKLSVTDEAGFMERYNVYLAIKDQAVKTFDSDAQGPSDIAKGIMALVQ